MVNNIKKLYDLTARQYEKRYKKIQFDKIGFILSRLDIGLKGKKILDLGAGTGFLEEYLIKEKSINKNSNITLVDLSENMLTLARKRLKGCKFKYLIKDLERPLNLKEKFDIIFSLTVLQNIKKSKRKFFINQIKSHLKEHAIAVITTLNKGITQKEFTYLLKTFKINKLYEFSEDLMAIIVRHRSN